MSDKYCFGCGRELIKLKVESGSFDPKTGKPEFSIELVCPKSDAIAWKGVRFFRNPFKSHKGDIPEYF